MLKNDFTIDTKVIFRENSVENLDLNPPATDGEVHGIFYMLYFHCVLCALSFGLKVFILLQNESAWAGVKLFSLTARQC